MVFLVHDCPYINLSNHYLQLNLPMQSPLLKGHFFLSMQSPVLKGHLFFVHAVTSLNQSPVLKGHLFFVPSEKISYELNLF
jgi:hypothetical protein